MRLQVAAQARLLAEALRAEVALVGERGAGAVRERVLLELVAVGEHLLALAAREGRRPARVRAQMHGEALRAGEHSAAAPALVLLLLHLLLLGAAGRGAGLWVVDAPALLAAGLVGLLGGLRRALRCALRCGPRRSCRSRHLLGCPRWYSFGQKRIGEKGLKSDTYSAGSLDNLWISYADFRFLYDREPINSET